MFLGEADQPRHPDRVRGHGRVARHRPHPLHQVLRGQVPLRGEDPEHDDDDDDTTLKFGFGDQSSVRGNCVLKYTQYTNYSLRTLTILQTWRMQNFEGIFANTNVCNSL